MEKKLFIFLFLAYAFFFNTLPGWNINSRMNLIYAIVDDHVLYIDKYIFSSLYGTGDAAIYNGHYYCDKSPILSFMGVPVYWLYRKVTTLTGWYLGPVVGRYPVVVLTVSLFSAIMAVILYRFLGYIRKSPNDQLWITLFYSLGTLAFPYSVLFYAHQMAAVFLLIGFYILFRLFHRDAQLSGKVYKINLVLAGFLTGLATVMEYPAGIGLIGLTGYAFFYMKKKNEMSWLLLGVFIPFLFPLPYNYACFGNPFTIGYHKEAHTFLNLKMSEGFMGITYPKWDAIKGITFSPYRGLFVYSPILLFAIPGFYIMYKEKKFQKEITLFLFIILTFFLFNFSYYAWSGGWGVGPRLMIPMLPFFIIPVYFLLPRWKTILIIFGLISILLFSAFCITDPQVRDNANFPLIDVTLPDIIMGNFTNNILSLFGISKTIAVFLWALYIGSGMFYLHRLTERIYKSEISQ